MATGTLPSVVNRCRTFLTLFLLIYPSPSHCQQFIIPFKEPKDCGVEEFFDISSLSCVKCGSNQRRSPTGLSCICQTGYQALPTDKSSINCQKCSTDKPAVTSDGFGCISCPGSLSDEGKCRCPQGNILGKLLQTGLMLFKCERCQASFTNTSCVCSPPNVQVSLVSIRIIHRCFVFVVCIQVFSNLTACQALGNMCVMNMHSFSAMSTDACGLFNTIFRSRAALSSTQDISYWRVNLPWLYYGDEPGLAIRVLQTNPVPIGFSFRGKNKNTEIKLIAAVYNVRGEFLRWQKIRGRSLQLCPDTAKRQEAAFSFGTAYREISELLEMYPEPLFYDVFMDLGDGDNRKLLPLPTLVSNQQYNGKFINQESMKNWYLSRRMFLVDTLSGREKPTQPKIPLSTALFVHKTSIITTFAVEYEMDQNEARMKTDTALGVMGGVAVLCSLLKTVSWKRRIASPLIDAKTMFTFLLFYAGDLANVFFVVTVGTGLYWLIFYKAQQFVYVLLPLPAQEEQFVTYIGCAFALKAVQFLHKLTLQLSVDVFLIDWERPRNKATTGEMKHDPSPVSIWRTYFVANEWNEIQTIRKISPTFQIMAVLFFLEVLGFSNLALRDPLTTLERSPQAYTPSYSLILRYGLAATLWLCIGFLQVIFFTVFYECFVEDKIRQFVDLCSVSNISVLLLSHRCFGYYIHGRSVHGHADTNMEEMNNNLKREGESLVAQRGLLPNTDIQTFQVSINNRLRSQYERIREPLSRRNRPSRLIDASSANQFEQSTRAYNTMNHFLRSVIDHVYPDMDYIVRDKLMFERVIGMEFLEPNEKSIFYNDDAHSFSNVLFYGNEVTLLIFDTLFFCVVDLGSQSFVLAAVLTYLQQMIFRLIRHSLGRRNLSNKTLVDERFLI
uniref:Transmembrane protein 67 n=1 Tax=Sphaeramia orbicularis TaxID=375764 RepID=A0A673A0L6_9TELE